MIDNHCHLQDKRIKGDVDQVLARARRSGVKKFICCGTSEKDWQDLREIALRFPQTVFPSFGVHPWFVSFCQNSWFMSLQHYLTQGSFGIGEIGLDYIVSDNHKKQIKVFEQQLELAKDLDLPVSIHCRKAWKDLFEIVKGKAPIRGMIHSYSGSKELLKEAVKLGFYISFSGIITFPKAKKVKEALLEVPLSRLLIESDSPDLPPFSIDVEKNEPANLSVILETVAKILKKDIHDVAGITENNALNLWKIPV